MLLLLVLFIVNVALNAWLGMVKPQGLRCILKYC